MASKGSPTPGSSSAPNPALTWDVFLSYRGPDTGATFTAHLYDALHRHGIQTYKDDYKLRLGEDITNALRDAIKASKIYIVVFSTGYATSPWCLDELVDIVRFKETEERLIIPVFHNIDPSIVRHVSGEYKEALEFHEQGHYKNQMQKVGNWRAALKVAANVSGEHVCDKNRMEPNVIHRIVADISLRIDPKAYHQKTVGMDFRVKSIEAMLSCEHPAGVIKIGIYGMGGVGKTTLAKAVFTKIYLRFEGSCFLANVTADDMKSLQQQLLNDVLQNKDDDVKNVDHGENLIRSKLKNTKILLVIDDLNHSDQLKSLGVESFAQGSVVIVTTRQEDILAKFRVEPKYRHEVIELDPTESLVLFKQHAFEFNAKPDNALLELANDIISYADGLPLALEVFGSSLQTKDTVEEWRYFIETLKKTPNKKIQDRLLISFNAMDDDPEVKKMFLDVACFFVGWQKERVFSILETYYSNVNAQIKKLKERCLLSIDHRDVLQMHDLLRDMGREVARNNSPDAPEKHSRLWVSEDIDNVLSEEDKGMEVIEGIYYPNWMASREVSLATTAFKMMKRLRFLHLGGFKNLTGSFDQTFKDLRWLSWNTCPLEVLPPEFKPRNLGILELPNSSMRTLKPGMVFKTLKILNMANSIYLDTAPDFTMLQGLVTLNLAECTSLKEVHASIGKLERLVSLNLMGCLNLTSLPGTIGDLKALKFLDVSNCVSLRELPEELGNIESLEELKIIGLNVEKLPHSIGLLCNLVVLKSSFSIHLQTLPDSICKLASLEDLHLDFCCYLEELPSNLGNIRYLKVLSMMSTSVSHLPDSIGNLSNLVELTLNNNYNLVTLPDTICNLRSLEILDIQWCKNLEKLPDQMGEVTSLRKLVLKDTPMLRDKSSQIPLSLMRLDISRNSFTALPSGISRLLNLEYLNVEECGQLLSIDELPPNLKELNAPHCRSMKTFRAILKHLEILNLESCDGLEEILHLEQLTSIREFNFTRCRNLWSIADLPPGLRLISAYQCSSLKRLPILSNSKHVKIMDLRDCTGLTEIQGLEELTSLKKLDLGMCINLLTIGELPPTLEWMKANGCRSMKKLPNLSNLKQLEMLDLTGCSGLTEIQGLDELFSIRELHLGGCSLSLLQHTLTKRFFQICSGFKDQIYLTLTENFPSWMIQLSSFEPRRKVRLDLTPNMSDNFLGMILCFEGMTSGKSNYSVKNITSGVIWSGSIKKIYRGPYITEVQPPGRYITIVPRTIFSVKDGDRRIECTADTDFFAVHLLYSD